VTPQRFLALLFTDIVASTERAVELRDSAWGKLRRRHHAVVRTELKRFGGRELSTAGDSFVAAFDEPERAIRCAAAINRGVGELGLQIRSGVHAGQVEGEDRDTGGLTFHVGARAAARADAGEVVVTEAVRQALAGSALEFTDRGPHALKGLPGEWRLFVVRAESLALHAEAPEARRWERLRPMSRSGRTWVAPGLGLLLGLGVLFGWLRPDGGPEPAGDKVLAVLPFENLGAAEDEYFADGMTDEVRGKLAGLPGLRVIAGRSSAEYKDGAKSLAEIGRELGADYLVVGKVRWERRPGGQSRVRVSPELIEVGSDAAPTTAWQAPFDAALTDVFQVQADIAGRVADELDVALGSEQRRELAARPTASLAAYDAYLKGEEATRGLTADDPASMGRGIEFYEQAVAHDPRFVPAWARLARAHAWFYANDTPTPSGAARARAAAERAIELAPGRPESQLALGDYYLRVANDPAKALAVYTAGLQAAPSSAELLASAAGVEQSLGRWEESLAHLTRARTLDPRSVLAARRLARTLLLLRRYPEAAAAYDRALALAPGDLTSIQGRAMVEVARGDLAGARATLRAAPVEVGDTALVTFVATYWDLGWTLDDAHQRLLLGLGVEAFEGDRDNWAIVLAQAHALRGDGASARVYADSARLVLEEQLRNTPDDAQLHAFLALMLAYLGREDDAVREGERAVALAPMNEDTSRGPYLQHQLVRASIVAGEHEKALEQLEPLLEVPYVLSPGWLRIDPNFDPLRGNPRFERLAGRP
jgi:class 3 adenylate cyclase/TolB-like protein/tetratricopeptide (TPR) repeat protein